MIEPIHLPYKFTPRDYQEELYGALETSVRYACINWHRRCGKDIACWNYLVMEAIRAPGNYFYVFPEATLAKSALWKNVNPNTGFRLLDHIPKVLVDSINNQEMLVTLKNKSTIKVLGIDKNPHGLRGTAIKGLVMSEVGYSSAAKIFYKASLPSIEQAKGFLIINSTPDGRGFFYDVVQMAKESNEWFYSEMQTMWPDRPNYTGDRTPEEIQKLITDKGYDPDDVEREYGVSFEVGIRGSYYGRLIEKVRDEGRVGHFPYDDRRPVDTFWDIGTNDTTAIWFRQVVGDRIHFIDYLEAKDQDTHYYAAELAKKPYNYGTHFLPHDGSHRTWQTRLTNAKALENHCRDYRISSMVRNNKRLPKLDGINAVRARMNRYHFNEETTSKAVDMISLYRKKYDQSNQTFSKEPLHDWTSNCADALRTEAMAEDDNINDFGGHQRDFKVVTMQDYDVLKGEVTRGRGGF